MYPVIEMSPYPNQSAPDPAVRGVASFTAFIERDFHTGRLVGHVPGFPGAHAHGADEEELRRNLTEVVGMLLHDGEPRRDCDAHGVMKIDVPIPRYDPLPPAGGSSSVPATADDVAGRTAGAVAA